ncbi:MAG: hypothetical protein ACOCRX_09455 [Candidatus Woesearchaeota archaeon]
MEKEIKNIKEEFKRRFSKFGKSGSKIEINRENSENGVSTINLILEIDPKKIDMSKYEGKDEDDEWEYVNEQVIKDGDIENMDNCITTGEVEMLAVGKRKNDYVLEMIFSLEDKNIEPLHKKYFEKQIGKTIKYNLDHKLVIATIINVRDDYLYVETKKQDLTPNGIPIDKKYDREEKKVNLRYVNSLKEVFENL